MIGKTLSIIGKILMWIGGIVFVIGLVRLNPFDIGPGFVLFVMFCFFLFFVVFKRAPGPTMPTNTYNIGVRDLPERDI